MRNVIGGLCALVMSALLPHPVLHAAGSCADLTMLAVAQGAITAAEVVDAATPPPGGGDPLPPFCRVTATLKPSADSDIKIEVWLPVSGWNGKLQAVGNGAFNGTFGYAAMGEALTRGYAAASTDTGHVGGGARWALGHPEKVTDFGSRAVHEMTVAAKQIVARHYATAPRFSYFNGCSAGGRQAMKAAQRFPADFDGIIAGAPGLDWTSRAARAVQVAQVLERHEPARLLAPQRQLLHRAVVQACDAHDGVKDGLLADPKRCSFDPVALQCTASSASGCLTPAQVDTARLIYSDARNPESSRSITGLAPGSELGWTDLGWTESARSTGLDQFRYIVYGDPAWDIQKFTFDRDIVRAEAADAGIINALDPNLKPFLDRGGKLIQYHGWSDPQISPFNSIQYYTQVRDAVGDADKISSGYRLFMAPGMGHCRGGEGPNEFDMVGALEAWVERGQAPNQIAASHATGGVVDRTRPLCPYPQIAAYKGSGSIDEAANFECRAP